MMEKPYYHCDNIDLYYYCCVGKPFNQSTSLRSRASRQTKEASKEVVKEDGPTAEKKVEKEVREVKGREGTQTRLFVQFHSCR